MRLAEVGGHGRARIPAPEGEAPADLCIAIVRSAQLGAALPSWAIQEAVSIQSGQTAKVSGSLSRGYQIQVK